MYFRAAILSFLLLLTLSTLPACKQTPPPTKADVAGRWVIDPKDYDDAAYNMVLNNSNSASSASELERAAKAMEVLLQANPPTYTFNEDGTFSATGGKMTVTGKWTMDGDVITVTSPSTPRPRTFQIKKKGLMVAVPTHSDGREVQMRPG